MKQKRRPFYRPPIVDFDLPILTHSVTGTADYELSYPICDRYSQVINQNHNQIYNNYCFEDLKTVVLTTD